MNLLKLEIYIIKPDLFKIISIILVISSLNILIYMRSGPEIHIKSSSELLLMLFGIVGNNLQNWFYWVFFCIPYIVVLFYIWRPSIKYFEINKVIRIESLITYWFTKLISGFIYTIIYLALTWSIIYIYLKLNNINIQIDIKDLEIFSLLLLNLYIHALILLLIRIVSSSYEFASIFTIAILFAGTKVEEPYLPLFYSMYLHFNNVLDSAKVISISIFTTFLLIIIILTIVRKKDFTF